MSLCVQVGGGGGVAQGEMDFCVQGGGGGLPRGWLFSWSDGCLILLCITHWQTFASVSGYKRSVGPYFVLRFLFGVRTVIQISNLFMTACKARYMLPFQHQKKKKKPFEIPVHYCISGSQGQVIHLCR